MGDKKERGFRIDKAGIKKMSDQEWQVYWNKRQQELKDHRVKMDSYKKKYDETHENKKAKRQEEFAYRQQVVAELKAKPQQTAKA
jgi:hypothetical protein